MTRSTEALSRIQPANDWSCQPLHGVEGIYQQCLQHRAVRVCVGGNVVLSTPLHINYLAGCQTQSVQQQQAAPRQSMPSPCQTLHCLSSMKVKQTHKAQAKNSQTWLPSQMRQMSHLAGLLQRALLQAAGRALWRGLSSHHQQQVHLQTCRAHDVQLNHDLPLTHNTCVETLAPKCEPTT